MQLDLARLPWPVYAVGAAAVLLLLYRAAGGTAADAGAALGGAAVDLAGGAVSGVALGVGDALGIPRTEETACQAALREGRLWDASFACPAGTFIRGAWSRVTD